MRRFGYIVAIIFNVIFLFIINNLLNWGIPFLTDDFVAVLFIFNISLIANIAVNFLFLFYDPNWFRRLAQIVLNIISIVVFYTLLIIFPFDFPSGPWNDLGRFVIIIIMVGIAIGTIVEIIRLITNPDRHS